MYFDRLDEDLEGLRVRANTIVNVFEALNRDLRTKIQSLVRLYGNDEATILRIKETLSDFGISSEIEEK